VACIAAFTLVPAAHYFAFPPEIRAHLALGEPWATLSFGAFALVALVHRVRLLRVERTATRAQAEAEWLARLAAMCFAVKDLANTPLQTLRLSTALLRRRHPEEQAPLAKMDRALDRLDQLDRTLSQYHADAPFQEEAESFDALAVLEKRGW
jgi:hypothetical protein